MSQQLEKDLLEGELGEVDVQVFERLRRRVARAIEQEAGAAPDAAPADREAMLERRPANVQALKVKHVAEYVGQAEDAIGRLTDTLETMRDRLEAATAEQAANAERQTAAEVAYNRLQAQYIALRDTPVHLGLPPHQQLNQVPPPVLGAQQPNPPHGPAELGAAGGQAVGPQQPQGGNVADGGQAPPPRPNNNNQAQPQGNDIEALARNLQQLQTDMRNRIADEVRRNLEQNPNIAAQPLLPPGCHAYRERPWTPAEYLALMGERTADAEMGFVAGLAGRPVIPRAELPPHDSSCPGPLRPEGRYLREVQPDELQGPNRVQLMNEVYGGETSAHQRRMAICFDSRDYTVWKTFYHEFKTLAGRESWTEIQRLNQLRSRLSGQAAATANRVEYVCGRVTSESDLVAVIRFHVLGETSVTDSRTRLDSRTRGPDESIRDYAFALLDLAELAYPGPNNQFVHHACEKFAATVSKSPHVLRELHRYTIGNPNPSMETLASMATKAERTEEMLALSATQGDDVAIRSPPGNAVGSSRPAVAHTTSTAGRSQSLPNTYKGTPLREEDFQWIAAFRGRDRSRSRSKDRKSRRDDRRSKSRSRDRSRSKNSYRSSSRNRSRDRTSSRDRPRTAKDTDTCFKCGGRGHFAADCPSPDSVRNERPRSRSRDKSGSSSSGNRSAKKQDGNSKKARSPRKRKDVAFKDVVDSVLAYQQALNDGDEQSESK